MDIPATPSLRDTVVVTLRISSNNNSHTVCSNSSNNNPTAYHLNKLHSPHLPEAELSIPIPIHLPRLLHLSPLLKGEICQDGTMLHNSLLHPRDLNRRQKNINQHLSCHLSPTLVLIQWLKREWEWECRFKDKGHHEPLHLHQGINLVYYHLHQKVLLDHHRHRQ
jgi:hypothetical protein